MHFLALDTGGIIYIFTDLRTWCRMIQFHSTLSSPVITTVCPLLLSVQISFLYWPVQVCYFYFIFSVCITNLSSKSFSVGTYHWSKSSQSWQMKVISFTYSAVYDLWTDTGNTSYMSFLFQHLAIKGTLLFQNHLSLLSLIFGMTVFGVYGFCLCQHWFMSPHNLSPSFQTRDKQVINGFLQKDPLLMYL